MFDTEWKKVKPTVISDLKKLINLFDDESKWCKRALAKTNIDEDLPNPYEKDASKYCLMGAAYKLEASNVTIGLLNRCARQENFVDIIDLNDKTSYDSVKAFLYAVLKSVKRK